MVDDSDIYESPWIISLSEAIKLGLNTGKSAVEDRRRKFVAEYVPSLTHKPKTQKRTRKFGSWDPIDEALHGWDRIDEV